MIINKLGMWFRIFWVSGKRLLVDDYTYKAAALSYTTLLSLVPLLSVLVSLITFFPFFTQFVDLARQYIMENFIPTSSSTIDFYLQNFIEQATHLPTLGILFLVVTVAMLIVTVEHAIDEIWGNPARHKKLIMWLIYWGVLIMMPILVGLSVFISSYVFSLSWLVGTHLPFLSILPLFINTAMFSALYIIVPSPPVRLKDGLMGGFVAAILFELAKIIFAYYLKRFPSYELIYGTLAIIPIFIFWVYISWMIVLYGAIVTHTKYQFEKK